MVGNNKTIASNSTIVISAEMLNKLIRIVLVVFSARLLGDTNYGKFTFALAFTTLFLIITDMGTHQLLVRELARKPEMIKKYLGNALVIKLFLSLFYLTSVFLIINLANKSSDVVTTVYIFAIYQIFISFNLFFKSVFQAFQRIKYDAVATLLQTILDTSFGITILLLGGNFQLLASMYLLASFLTLVYCLRIVTTKFSSLSLQVDFSTVKFFFHEGLPFGIIIFFAMMYTYIDSVMLSLMVNDEVVGWYNAAYRLVFTMLVVPTVIRKAVFPALSKFYKESIADFTRLFEETFKVMLFLGVSLAFLISLLADKIILLFYGKEYINAAGALQILVWGTALIFSTTVMTHATRSANRQRFTAKVVGFGAFLNLGLNFVFIPKYSYIGAAFATLITEASTFLFHLIYLSNKLVKPPVLKLLPKILIINIVMCIYILVFRELNIFLLFVTGLIVNGIMTGIIHYFTKDELAFLKGLLKF